MNILITGSSGTIGTRLCERLMEAGHTVTGLDWVPTNGRRMSMPSPHQIDLRDATKLRELIKTTLSGKSFDCVVHLAANARVRTRRRPTKALDNFTTLFNTSN